MRKAISIQIIPKREARTMTKKIVVVLMLSVAVGIAFGMGEHGVMASVSPISAPPITIRPDMPTISPISPIPTPPIGNKPALAPIPTSPLKLPTLGDQPAPWTWIGVVTDSDDSDDGDTTLRHVIRNSATNPWGLKACGVCY